MRIPILKMFQKSPFKPLRKHMEKAQETISFLKPLFDAFAERDYKKMDEISEKIFKLEHKCDIIKNEIRNHLPRSIFMPVSRNDFLKYLHDQDGLADKIEDIAVLLRLKKLFIPEEIKEKLSELIDCVLKCIKLAARVTYELDRIMEASFGEKGIEDVFKIIDEISETEWRADKKQFTVAKVLLELENKLSPVDITLWFEILKELGELANRAESLGKDLRLMLAKG